MIPEPRHTRLVTWAGDLDYLAAIRCSLELEAAWDAEIIVVDFTEVKYLDSIIMGLLADFNAKAKDAHKTLRVVVASPQLLKIFKVSGLGGAVSIHQTREDALGAAQDHEDAG